MRTFLVLVLATAVLAPAAVAAPTRMAPAGTVTGRIVSDGEHAVALQATATTVRVVRTGSRAATLTGAGPAGCGLVAVRAATVLWGCPQADPSDRRILPRLQHLDTGATTAPANLAGSPWLRSPIDGEGPGAVQPTGLGRRLLAGAIGGYHWGDTFVSARADAAVRPLLGTSDPRLAGLDRLPGTRVLDLDLAAGSRALCAPLVRPPGPDAAYIDPEGGFWPYTYVPPWGLADRQDGTGTLQRCGRAKTTTVGCRGCRSLTLAGHHVLWVDPAGAVRVLDLATGRTRRLAVPDADRHLSPYLAVTEDAVFLSYGYGAGARPVLRAPLD